MENDGARAWRRWEEVPRGVRAVLVAGAVADGVARGAALVDLARRSP